MKKRAGKKQRGSSGKQVRVTSFLENSTFQSHCQKVSRALEASSVMFALTSVVHFCVLYSTIGYHCIDMVLHKSIKR